LQFERNDWKFGLMLRDITTTYNVWNINEKEVKKLMLLRDKIKNYLKYWRILTKSTIRNLKNYSV
jgi:hypothetical protein